MKKTFIKVLSIAAIGLLGISLSACGKKDDEVKLDTTEYVTEYVEVEARSGENSYSSSFSINGDYLTYLKAEYSSFEGEEDSYESNETFKLISKNVKTGEEKQIPIKISESTNAYPGEFRMTKDGSFVGTVMEYSEDFEEVNSFLVNLDGNGSIIKKTNISDSIKADNLYINSLILVNDGLVLGTGQDIYKIDFDGKLIGKISTSNYINSISTTPSGKVFVCIDGNQGMNIKSINDKFTDFDQTIDVEGWGSAYGADDENILYCTYRGLQQININTNEKKDLFSWIDVDVDSTNFDSVVKNDDGSLTAMYYDYENGKYEIIKIREALDSEKGSKETIVLGTYYIDSDVRRSIVKFNRTNSNARIKVIEYMNDDTISYEDSLKKFTADLGNGVFDLVDLSSSNSIGKYTKALEPLDNYITKDLDKNEYFEKVLDACSYNGKIYAMPKTFSVTTLAISKKHADEIGSWTIKDLVALRKKYGDKTFMERGTQSQALYLALLGSFDTFVDENAGKCNFDSEDFKEALEFAKTFKADDNFDYDFDSWGAIKTDDILLFDVYLNSLEYIQIFETLADGGIEIIGYPSNEGGKHIINAYSALSITSKSKHKDLAWEFIKSFVNEDEGSYGRDLFNVHKAKTDAIMKKAMEKELDIEGNEVSKMSWGNGQTSVDLYAATQEQVDMAYEVIEKASSSEGMDDEVVQIILEECQPYFNNQKSVEETVKVIQSRVNIFLQERK